jgi:hypothetical protein
MAAYADAVMSALLALLVLGGAIWFVITLAGGGGARREPMDSVNEFARAMSALNPTPPAAPTRRTGVPARR